MQMSAVTHLLHEKLSAITEECFLILEEILKQILVSLKFLHNLR